MKRWWPTPGWLAFLLAGQCLISSLPAQESPSATLPAKSFSDPTNKLPPPAAGNSPVDLFRQLLAMAPEARDEILTNRPPQVRARILAKVGEYEALDPNERTLRLRATELRWYLMPLLRELPANRAARLAQIPADVRELVQSRLEQWNILPPTLRQEFLENEPILSYFAHVDSTLRPAGNSGREPKAYERAHWNNLSEPERRQISEGFNQFFELTPEEKETALSTLSDTERHQMEKTLQAFDNLPPSQRAECAGAFAKFAGLNAAEQAKFLKNAERWSAMSPAERQAWRDLVVNVPQWPPLPVGYVVPIPGEPVPTVATNHN